LTVEPVAVEPVAAEPVSVDATLDHEAWIDFLSIAEPVSSTLLSVNSIFPGVFNFSGGFSGA
jgi:hypothetical protein